jgi:4-amino-4-deoxy-L-arabinose transferase-like glycosyltransferase
MVSSPVQGIGLPTREHRLIKYSSILGVLLGVLIRLIQYLSNRSLWSDEAMVALNIVNRSYSELLRPLDYNQAAPPGFLWIEKLAVEIFGNNEYALRLFPFLCGLISLFAFYRLAIRYASAIAAPIAIVLFASLKYVVYYTTEVKQYSSDVMVALLLCLLLIPLRQQVLKSKQLLLLAVLGAVFIWFSHPSVLVMAGIEVGYWLITSNQQRVKLIINRLPMYLAWLASFASLYLFSIHGTLENEHLVSSWEERYPESLLDFVWLYKAFDRFFSNPLGFTQITDTIALFAFIVGCIALYRRNKPILLAMIAPIITTIIAAYLHQYPFRQRLALFLAPFAIILIAEGIAYFLTRTRQQRKLSLILGISVLLALLTPAVTYAGQLIVYPAKVQEIRPVIAYVQAHQKTGDSLYVYRAGKVQFLYYAPKFDYTPNDYVIGQASMASGAKRKNQLVEKKVKQFKREIRSFQEKSRVWFLFCNTSETEERMFLSTVEPLGQQLEAFRQYNAFVYLYDLSG